MARGDGLETVRRRAFDVGYRMLGSVTEADDVAQETVLRMDARDVVPDEPAAWATTVATRIAIDHLRSARVRREVDVGPWLPEPLVADPDAGPAGRAEVGEQVSQALLVALERLSPLERAALVLHDAFGYDHARVASVLDRSPSSSRQLVSRARRRVGDGPPRFDVDPARGRALLERFLAAAEEGDLAALEETLAADVALHGDGGGRVEAAPAPVVGAAAVARFLAGIAAVRRRLGPFELELVTMNGQPGRVLRTVEGRVWDALGVDVVDGRITAVRILRNPDKLGHLARRDRD